MLLAETFFEDKEKVLMKLYISNALDILSQEIRQEILEFGIENTKDEELKNESLDKLSKLKSNLGDDKLMQNELQFVCLGLIAGNKMDVNNLIDQLNELRSKVIDGLQNNTNDLSELIKTVKTAADINGEFEA